ncbi:MAG: tryptophan--tRNA ligase [archaeon]
MVKEDFNVTPWDVKGEIDYDKLVKEFGLNPLKHLPSVFDRELVFRRGLVFAHRDFARIIEAIEEKKKFVVMTGLMPTGKFHIGHMTLVKQLIFYQGLGAKVYIAVADIEAYNARGQSLEESRKIAIEDYITNYIALGLKKENCEIYFQSARSEDARRANAYYRLQNLLARHGTFNEFKAVYGEISPGKMVSALLQASDMLHPQLPEFDGSKGKGVPVLVPVGADQDPHLRLARGIARRLKMHDFVPLSSTAHTFIPGLKGGKMSASDETSYIALTDTPKEAEKKIKKYAFSGGRDTLEEHRKLGGNPDVDVSFQYLKFLFEEDDRKLAKIEADYRYGKMLTSELKNIVITKINKFLGEHQKRRDKLKGHVEKFLLKA